MGTIRQLPKEVAERIAAGEVVERPASVVKELIENSIDAGAVSVVVDVIDGGRERIAVIDDGTGMDEPDLKLCVMRHATSKIGNENDLFNISTMGFRGEALSAIGAVSRLSIESRRNDPSVIEGVCIGVDGGVVSGPTVAGCAPGTKVLVSELFFNVPARRKFLRSATVEFGHIEEVVRALALANPNIRFDLSSDGRKKFSAYSKDAGERAGEILEVKPDAPLIFIEETGAGLRVSGWVAKRGRGGGKDVHIFLNRRPVRDRVLMHALTQGFGDILGRGEFPASALWIDIDPSQVDVNVHPTKREVRFSNSGAVHDFAMSAVRKAVTSVGVTSTFVQSADFRSGGANAIYRFESRRNEKTSDYFPLLCKEGKGEVDRKLPDLPHLTSPYKGEGYRPLGQLGFTYVVCEGRDGELVLIDQHAAHERMGYDALKAQYAKGSVAGQRLLIPERLELGAKGWAYVIENLELLTKTGFEIEPFGGGSLLVKSVPALLGLVPLAPIFEKLAGELEEVGSSTAVDSEIDRIFAVVACHAQVRAGDKLSPEELSAFVRDVERQNITHCPHGRPAVVRIEKGEIEKRFGRRN